MNIDLNTLEAAAKAATPGPWNVFNGFTVETCPDEKGYTTAVVDGYVWDRAVSVKDAIFIAAANPAVVLELISELRAKNKLLEEVFDDYGDKNGGVCPVCHMYRHKHWCWYPHLAKMLGKPLDVYDERFLALDNAIRTAAKNKTDCWETNNGFA